MCPFLANTSRLDKIGYLLVKKGLSFITCAVEFCNQ